MMLDIGLLPTHGISEAADQIQLPVWAFTYAVRQGGFFIEKYFYYFQ